MTNLNLAPTHVKNQAVKYHRKKIDKICIICGETFSTVNAKQVTCSYVCGNKKRWGHTSDPKHRLKTILSNIKITDNNCWEYQGCLSEGYGIVKYLGETLLLHRLAYEEKHNVKIPAGLLVCHSCDNPPCINPDHLFLGTHQDNATDSQRKGRKVKKVSEEDRGKLIDMANAGLDYYEIGSRLGISFSTAAFIARENGIFRKSPHKKRRVKCEPA